MVEAWGVKHDKAVECLIKFPGRATGFAKFTADETEKWDKVIQAANIKAE